MELGAVVDKSEDPVGSFKRLAILYLILTNYNPIGQPAISY